MESLSAILVWVAANKFSYRPEAMKMSQVVYKTIELEKVNFVV